jgi:hypothetical protein
MTTPGKTVVLFALLSGLSSACSTSAALERRNGPTLVGTIEASDANRLYLAVDENERYWIARSDITDIDHPGKTGIVVGSGLIFFGGGLLALSPFLSNDCVSDCFLSRSGLALFAGIPMLVSGISVLLTNLAHYRHSVAAAKAPSTATYPPTKSLTDPTTP